MKKRMFIIALLGIAVMTFNTPVMAQEIKENTVVNEDAKLSQTEQYISYMSEKVNRLEDMTEKYPKSDDLINRYETAKKLCEQSKQRYEEIKQNNIPDNKSPFSIELCDSLILKNYIECAHIDESFDEEAYYKSILFYGYEDVSEERKAFVHMVMSLEGAITYKWGGKPQKPGWDDAWNNGSGLDCSGFVEWSYWTTFNEENPDYYSTLSITHSLEEIPHDQLQPGDLGTITADGTCYFDAVGNKFSSYEKAQKSNTKYAEEEKQKKITKKIDEEIAKAKKKNPDVNISQLRNRLRKRYNKSIEPKKYDVKTMANHVGIYMGLDDDGNEMWVHCTGGKTRTVVINKGCFKHYYKLTLPSEEE